jgi:hypothetical protein
MGIFSRKRVPVEPSPESVKSLEVEQSPLAAQVLEKKLAEDRRVSEWRTAEANYAIELFSFAVANAQRFVDADLVTVIEGRALIKVGDNGHGGDYNGDDYYLDLDSGRIWPARYFSNSSTQLVFSGPDFSATDERWDWRRIYKLLGVARIPSPPKPF